MIAKQAQCLARSIAPRPGASYPVHGKLRSITRARCLNVMRLPGLALNGRGVGSASDLRSDTKAITCSMSLSSSSHRSIRKMEIVRLEP